MLNSEINSFAEQHIFQRINVKRVQKKTWHRFRTLLTNIKSSNFHPLDLSPILSHSQNVVL